MKKIIAALLIVSTIFLMPVIYHSDTIGIPIQPADLVHPDYV